MKLDTLALFAFIVIGLALAVVYGAAILVGAVATFPYGLPALILIGVFVFIAIMVVVQRLGNKEDAYYERHIDE